MAPIFALPNELLLSTILSSFPGRERQMRSLATLLSINASPCRNIVLYGLEATGKSAVTKAILEVLSSADASARGDGIEEECLLDFTVVKSAECVSGRHLLEQTIGNIAKAIGWQRNIPRCENLAQLVFETGRLLEKRAQEGSGKRRLVIVFDGIDCQREAPATLLQALARMGEIIPNLTTVFIMTAPRPNILHISGVPHIHFSPYTKADLLKILSLTSPSPELPGGPDETQTVWNHFCAAVWESLSKHAGRDVLSFREVCNRIWPIFVRPVLEGTYSATPFSRLLVANRALFQNDSLLVPSMLTDTGTSPATVPNPTTTQQGIGTQLPYFSRLLLVAAYLASYNPPRTDQIFFLKTSAAKRRKKGGGTALSSARPSKHRKISRKLLGPQAFVIERLLAIFHAIRADTEGTGKYVPRGKAVSGGDADIQMAIATLASLRLLVKMGSASASDVLDGGCKFKVAIGWEAIRTIARSVGIEAEEYLAE